MPDLLIIQTGAAIFIQTSIGADLFTIFTTGIARLLHMNVGNANLFLSIVFTVVIVVLLREWKQVNIGIDLTFLTIGFFLCGVDTFGSTLGFGTVLNALIQGPLIQFFMERLEKGLRPVLGYDGTKEQPETEML